MKKTFITLIAILFALTSVTAQKAARKADVKPEGYIFTTVVSLPATPVKNQSATGTCWCFATTSFMSLNSFAWEKGNMTSQKCML
jgi:bleomycin hydrolase